MHLPRSGLFSVPTSDFDQWSGGRAGACHQSSFVFQKACSHALPDPKNSRMGIGSKVFLKSGSAAMGSKLWFRLEQNFASSKNTIKFNP
jgi:hypothetical protein